MMKKERLAGDAREGGGTVAAVAVVRLAEADVVDGITREERAAVAVAAPGAGRMEEIATAGRRG